MWNVTNKYIVVINYGTDVTNNGTNKLEIDTNNGTDNVTNPASMERCGTMWNNPE